MQSITATALHQKIINKEDIELIDVREIEEHAEFNIGGTLIPLATISRHAEDIATAKPVIIYCRKGIRSQIAIQRLQKKNALHQSLQPYWGHRSLEKNDRYLMLGV